MGFTAENLRAASNGNTQGDNICLTLRPFCGGFNTPLRQLSEKLGCLTKRTPRSLGDLFGFTWHLNGQLFGNKEPTNGAMEELAKKLVEAFKAPPTNKVPHFMMKLLEALASKVTVAPSPPRSTSSLSSSFESMANAIPFLFELFMGEPKDSLPTKLFELKSSKHNGTHNDLYSLFKSNCSQPNCGPYLYPITHSDGATYAPRNASTYLSWVLYLSDDLQSWFQEMLDEFTKIDCSNSGCAGQPKCQVPHKTGTHGNPSQCTCPSVVQCGGTLPLLYRHGFRYYSPFELMGGKRGSNETVTYDGETKRTCHQFAQQPQKVISTEAPLDKLITTIDAFLYAIRWEFFSKLSTFWTIYTCLILYTFFFLLDTLRARSHLKLTSSHAVPPLALLTSGKALPITKLTYVTQ
ncbi:extracellular matrix-binding ebh, putative [Babesia caballi]|uniref:Extracellular matrix-binding ebh, putative n=1 Tax=Babesia caballi TaxID=5871 RepID=A0AAV4LSV5_BABCB|nr:extracellular matrix-binding ebh, putative [Babesia caballi]